MFGGNMGAEVSYMALSPKYPQYSDEEIVRRIKVRYVEQCWTLDDIAEKYSISKPKVRRLLLKAGVVLRRRGPDAVADTKIRRCKDCGGEFPLDKEHFHKDKTKHLGFSYRCRTCESLRWRRVEEDT
jgi:hypothetical protein